MMAEMIPRTYEFSARKALSDAFREDWSNSLKAGWTFEEFKMGLREAGLELTSVSDQFSQLHWVAPQEGGFRETWKGETPDAVELKRVEKLANALGFPGILAGTSIESSDG